MNDNIILNVSGLETFLDWIGLPQASRERVVEIDRILAEELERDEPDAGGCAALVIEAADLIADCDPPCFDWADFDFDELDWGAE